MADPILVQETTFQGTLSPQRSQTSLYSAPEVVTDLYHTGSSLGGKPRNGSPGLSSSFVLISDESHSGEQPLSTEYVEVSQKPSRTGGLEMNIIDTAGSTDSSAERVTQDAKPSPCPGVDSTTRDVQRWLEESEHLNSAAVGVTVHVPIETASPLLPKITTTLISVGTQTQTVHHYHTANIRDGATQTLPEIKDSEVKRQSAVGATTPTSVLEHADLRLHDQVSPLGSPSDEVVDMSASTVLIERHISQKEGRMLKSSNKELRLKIKKLTEILEQMQKENKRLKNETESGVKIAAAQTDKERELKRQIEEMEEQQELELEQYRKEIQKAAEYEERVEEELKGNTKIIAELQKTISALQKQLVKAQEECKKYSEKAEALSLKLEACETKALVAESENSVLNEKVNSLMKELATLKKSKHHHHHHQQQLQSDEKSKHPVHSSNGGENPLIKDHSVEDVPSKSDKEQELIKQDQLEKHVGATQGGGDVMKLEASLAHDVFKSSHPKPKPRQKQPYEAHNPHALASSSTGPNKASKPKEGRPPNKPVQALVAPKLQSVAHLQPLKQLPSGAKYGEEYLLPYYHHEQQQVSKPAPPKVQSHGGASAAEGRLGRPSFLPLKGQTQAPLQLVEPQATQIPPPPLSDAQKLAATANWVKQLPEPKERKQKIEKQDQKIVDKTEKPGEASALTIAEMGNDLNSLSEERIEEITRQLKGDSGVVCECPICGKVLHSRESDYGVLLHVELCLQQAGAAN